MLDCLRLAYKTEIEPANSCPRALSILLWTSEKKYIILGKSNQNTKKHDGEFGRKKTTWLTNKQPVPALVVLLIICIIDYMYYWLYVSLIICIIEYMYYRLYELLVTCIMDPSCGSFCDPIRPNCRAVEILVWFEAPGCPDRHRGCSQRGSGTTGCLRSGELLRIKSICQLATKTIVIFFHTKELKPTTPTVAGGDYSYGVILTGVLSFQSESVVHARNQRCRWRLKKNPRNRTKRSKRSGHAGMKCLISRLSPWKSNPFASLLHLARSHHPGRKQTQQTISAHKHTPDPSFSSPERLISLIEFTHEG